MAAYLILTLVIFACGVWCHPDAKHHAETFDVIGDNQAPIKHERTQLEPKKDADVSDDENPITLMPIVKGHQEPKKATGQNGPIKQVRTLNSQQVSQKERTIKSRQGTNGNEGSKKQRRPKKGHQRPEKQRRAKKGHQRPEKQSRTKKGYQGPIKDVGVIGGHQITIDKVPFMASLRLNGTYHWCGASIIHEKFVITAAHCCIANSTFKVLVGTDDMDKNGKLYEIEDIIKHENFNNKTSDYDVCMIKLKEPLTFGPKVAKIPLASSKTIITKGTMMNVTGWGSTALNTSPSEHLLQVGVPFVPRQICQIKYFKARYAITNHMICAGSTGHDACQGDSGGPLTLGNELVGITSFGVDCGLYPGVYTKISSVLTWINNIIETH